MVSCAFWRFKAANYLFLILSTLILVLNVQIQSQSFDYDDKNTRTHLRGIQKLQRINEMTQEIYAKQDEKIINKNSYLDNDQSTKLLINEQTFPRKMPVISDEPVFSSDDRSKVVKVKHRKPSTPSNYQPEALFEPSKEDIIRRPVSQDTADNIDEMMNKVKSRFVVNENNDDINVFENEKKLINHQKTISDEETLKKERIERIRARWAKLGPIIKNRVNKLFSKARLSQNYSIGKEIRRFSTTTPKTFELDKKQFIENNFDTLTQVNYNSRPVLHSVRTMTDEKFLNQNQIKNIDKFEHINRPPIARPTFSNQYSNINNKNVEDDYHNRSFDNTGEERRTHYRFVNKVSSRPRLRIRRPENSPAKQNIINEVARSAGSSASNRHPLSLPELSPITNEESIEIGNNKMLKSLPSIDKSDDISSSTKSDESNETILESLETSFGKTESKNDESFKSDEGDDFEKNFKSKQPINIEVEPPSEPTTELSGFSNNHPKKKVKEKYEETGIVPQNSGLRPVAPPSEFSETGGFGSGFGGGSGKFDSGLNFGEHSESQFSKTSKNSPKTKDDKLFNTVSNKDKDEQEEEEEDNESDNSDTGFNMSKGPSFGTGTSESYSKKQPEFNTENLFTGDSALSVNNKGPTGDGYGPPISDGAAIPPPVHGISYGGGAAGVGNLGMVESFTQNPPTTVKPSALLNILNKADQGINQAITHFERGSPVETAAIDILEVALGSQRLDSQAKLLGHVDRTFGLDNLQRLQRWANTGGALDMLKEQFAKIAKNYRPPPDLLPTIPPQLEYLFSSSNNGKR
uniref:SXP/RAL-2 family protein Ani s 5-like cation-binding domain-containing protein n=1 Tax=Strongyloides stercoralis TaxID=6248 RepID=A0A0K0ECU9_STRER